MLCTAFRFPALLASPAAELPGLGWTVALAVLAGVNLFAFLQMGWDKRQARLDRSRVSERRLRAPVWVGGAPGVFAGMGFFRHKSSKPSFQRSLWLQTAGFVALAAGLAWLRFR